MLCSRIGDEKVRREAMHLRRLIGVGCFVSVCGLWTHAVRTQGAATGEWRYYGGDKGYTRYSPVDQINRDNVSKLKIVWRRPALDPQLREEYPDLSPSPYYKATPIMVDGVLYAPNAVGLIEAFDAGSGKTIWVQEPLEKNLAGVAGQS